MKEGAINFAPSFYLIPQANPINSNIVNILVILMT
jgi:hypothetical protein